MSTDMADTVPADRAAGCRPLHPLGAAVDALQDSMFQGFPPAAPLLILAAYAVVFGFLAKRFFRWE